MPGYMQTSPRADSQTLLDPAPAPSRDRRLYTRSKAVRDRRLHTRSKPVRDRRLYTRSRAVLWPALPGQDTEGKDAELLPVGVSIYGVGVAVDGGSIVTGSPKPENSMVIDMPTVISTDCGVMGTLPAMVAFSGRLLSLAIQ
jgi:hypothetical protein